VHFGHPDVGQRCALACGAFERLRQQVFLAGDEDGQSGDRRQGLTDVPLQSASAYTFASPLRTRSDAAISNGLR